MAGNSPNPPYGVKRSSKRVTRGNRSCHLNAQSERLLSRAMKLLLAIIVWLAMAAVLVKGILMAMSGSLWLLLLGLLAFVVLVGKIGCLSHD